MGRGGARPGAGRPKGAKDSPLVLARTLTSQEARAINEDAQVIRARVKLAAWEALGDRVANLAAYPPKEQTAILALALRYAGDHTATPVQSQNEEQRAAQVAAQVRHRLDGLADRLGQLGRPAALQIEAEEDDVYDAELVWPTRAELPR